MRARSSSAPMTLRWPRSLREKQDVPASELACHLQIKALANAFESASIEHADAASEKDMYAVTSALAEGSPRHYADLPLWVAAAS